MLQFTTSLPTERSNTFKIPPLALIIFFFKTILWVLKSPREGAMLPHTSVLMLRLREKASRMAESRLGLSACRLPTLTGSSRSSWLTVW